RPTERRERPQRRGEPGVEHVGVLAQPHTLPQAMPGANLGLAPAHIDALVAVIPRRYPVAPPELAADAPVLDVAHPLVIGLGPVLRNETGASALDGFEGRAGERGNLHVPLVGEVRLEHRTRAVSAGHLEAMFFDALEQPGRLELGD